MSRWSPVRLGLSALALLAVILLIVFFNPLTGFLHRQLEEARADEETAIDGQVSGQYAAEGQAEVEAAAGEVRIIVEQAREAAHDHEIQARVAPGADDPLDAAAVDRLRQSDDILCGLRPGICAGSGDRGTAQAGDPG